MKPVIAGRLLLLIGIVLTGFSLYLSVYLWRAMHGIGAHWNGSPVMTALTERTMLLLLLFGLCSTLTGLFQVVTARRNVVLSTLLLLVTGGLVATCYQIIQLKGH